MCRTRLSGPSVGRVAKDSVLGSRRSSSDSRRGRIGGGVGLRRFMGSLLQRGGANRRYAGPKTIRGLSTGVAGPVQHSLAGSNILRRADTTQAYSVQKLQK